MTDALIIRERTLETPVGPAYGEVARIGLIALSTDLAIERDFARMSDDEVTVFTTRIALRTPNSEETFRELETSLPDAAALLIPTSRLDIIAFGCTAASILIGSDRIATAIRKGAGQHIKVTDTAQAIIAAMRSLKAQKIAMLTPYTPSVTKVTAGFLHANGIDVVDAAGLGFDMDDTHARIPTATLIEEAMSLDYREADAIFLSCTATRGLNAIAELEARTGKPVITSNQATCWHARQLAGATTPLSGFGQLFSR